MVKGGPEGVDIGTKILDSTLYRLGRDVVWSRPDFLGLGLSCLRHQREAEIHELRVAFGIKQDVAGLYITVDQAGRLRALEPLRHLDRERQGFHFWNAPPLPDVMLEMAAGHKLHRDVESPEGLAGSKNAHHVRVAETGRKPGLILEGRDPLLVTGKLLAQDFQRHLTVEGAVRRDENGAHAADRVPPVQDVGAELLFHPILDLAGWTNHAGIRRMGRDIHRRTARITHYDFLFPIDHLSDPNGSLSVWKLRMSEIFHPGSLIVTLWFLKSDI